MGLWVAAPGLRKSTDMFLPVSASTAAGNGLPGSGTPYQVVPNFLGPDLDDGDSGDFTCLERLPCEPYLLFVGALGKHKGLNVLLEAYAGLSHAPPLVLIGIPWNESPVEFPSGVTLLENVPHSAVMRAWRHALIGVAPSLVPEACPTVIMEAMASGVPTVASAIGAIPELLTDGQTGLLVRPGDVVALREAIERLLHAPDLRERLGQAAQKHAVAFRSTTVIPMIERVYAGVLSGGQLSRASREADTGHVG
jgi:glycosyltransferase involved in cell wall biosynthesis